MKCTIFVGRWYDAQYSFNNWAKGKDLTRDVIIHEQVIYPREEEPTPQLLIIVYHPDTPEWNRTETKTTAYTEVETVPKQRIAEEPIQA
jgi:hypothetical protein